MRELRAEAPGFDFRGAQCIHDDRNRQGAADRVADLEAIHQILRLRGPRAGNVQQGLVVADDLGQGDQALLVIMGAGNRNVEKFRRGERGGLRRFGGLDAVGVRHHVHFFAHFLDVIQGEGKFGGGGSDLNGLATQNEEVHLLHLYGVFAGWEIFDREIAGVVRQRGDFGLSQTFKFYLNPGDGLSVLVQHSSTQGKCSACLREQVGGAKTPSEQERHRCSRNSQTMEHA